MNRLRISAQAVLCCIWLPAIREANRNRFSSNIEHIPMNDGTDFQMCQIKNRTVVKCTAACYNTGHKTKLNLEKGIFHV